MPGASKLLADATQSALSACVNRDKSPGKLFDYLTAVKTFPSYRRTPMVLITLDKVLSVVYKGSDND